MQTPGKIGHNKANILCQLDSKDTHTYIALNINDHSITLDLCIATNSAVNKYYHCYN